MIRLQPYEIASKRTKERKYEKKKKQPQQQNQRKSNSKRKQMRKRVSFFQSLIFFINFWRNKDCFC